jgi:transcriptional regulator with XRE-family HTH domain
MVLTSKQLSIIKTRRMEMKITQKEMGKMVGMSGSAISYIESGDHGIDPSVYESICKKLCIDPKTLKGGAQSAWDQLPQKECLDVDPKWLCAPTNEWVMWAKKYETELKQIPTKE